MARRGVPAKHKISPDAVYGSEIVTKFINHVMKGGKRSVAESIVYEALQGVSDATRKDPRVDESLRGNPLALFEAALRALKPAVEVKSRRVGGATYQVPVEVSPERRTALAMRWLIDAARKRPWRGLSANLEIVKAAQDDGQSGGESGGAGSASASLRRRCGKAMSVGLMAEIIDLLTVKKGQAYATLQNVSRMAAANQAFSHYRF